MIRNVLAETNRPEPATDARKQANAGMNKYFYKAEIAEEEYRRDLVDYRSGINLTTKERDFIAGVIAPLLKQGQSVHQILSAHPEIKQSQRTLYYYIESGVFKDFGVDCFSLKEQGKPEAIQRKIQKAQRAFMLCGQRIL